MNNNKLLERRLEQLNALELPNGVALWSALEPMELGIMKNEATQELEIMDYNANEVIEHSSNPQTILSAILNHSAFKNYMELYLEESLSPEDLFKKLLGSEADEIKRIKRDSHALDKQFPYLSKMVEEAGIQIKPYKEMPTRVQQDIQEWEDEIDEDKLYYTTVDETEGFSDLSDVLLYWYSDQDLSSGFMEKVPQGGMLDDLLEQGVSREEVEGYRSILRLAERDGYLNAADLKEIGVLVEEKYYAVYDTQYNDFRTLGVFETSNEAMEAAADHFVNVLEPEIYEEMGGEAHFYHSTAKEDGELLGFTAVEISAKEAGLLNQASQINYFIYYHDSYTGSGDTYKKFPSINRNRTDIYGVDLQTGQQLSGEPVKFDKRPNPLAREFLEGALGYLRINGELSVEEREEVAQLGTPVTPRTDQELNLILQNDWFKDLYDVFDDELNYFNGVKNAELTRLDIENEISNYLESHPFHLDLPTLYSLAQKGGTMGFTAPSGASEGEMDYANPETVRTIYDNPLKEQGLQEALESLGIVETKQLQKILMDHKALLTQRLDLRTWALEMMQEVEGGAEIVGELPLLKASDEIATTFYNPIYTDGKIISFSIIERDKQGYFEPIGYDMSGNEEVEFSDMDVEEIETLEQASPEEREQFQFYMDNYPRYQAKQQEELAVLRLKNLALIEEIGQFPNSMLEKDGVLSSQDSLLDKEFQLMLVQDYRKAFSQDPRIEINLPGLSFESINNYSDTDFILFSKHRHQAVFYVGEEVEGVVDFLYRKLDATPELRTEGDKKLEWVSDFNQEKYEVIQDWMMDHLEFMEHYHESVDIPIIFNRGKYEGPDDYSSDRSYLDDTTDYWVDYEGSIAEIGYEPGEIASLEKHELPFEAVVEILEAVDLTAGKVVEMLEVEKGMKLGESILKSEVPKQSSIGYYQKVIDQTVYATGTIQGRDIEKIEYYEEQAFEAFEMSRLTDKELVALTLNLIHQIYDTTRDINEMESDDPDRQDGMNDYENEQKSYDKLSLEWESRGVNVPLRAASFDAIETEDSEPFAHYFEESLSDYLTRGSINFKEEFPLPQKDNHSSIHLK